MVKHSVILGMLVVSAGTGAQACEECQLRKGGTYLGQFTLMGNGTVRSWVKYQNGKPSSLGVTLSESAITGLRTNLPKQMPVVEYKLALPKEAKVTGFDHISLDWAPQGHVPKGVYDKPHFDIHFYTMAPAERLKITAVGKDLAICSKKPTTRFIPTGYIAPPETSIPQMGMHAIDSASPELNGQPFSSTFIYGYYNGQMNFVEPMVALSFLQTKANFSAPVKVPAAYAKQGYYPTLYSVTYDQERGEYSVALEGLIWRAGATLQPKRLVLKPSKPQ
jgi:hypothetical protein